MDPSTLQIVWFGLIWILWIGYFVLEGFDFGVGMLLRHVGRNPAERRAVLHTVGPVWDGNEVWLLVAGGATFAAFPLWYATLFSGFYLALLLILIALIMRNVSFEFWGKRSGSTWRSGWEWAIAIGSAVPALLWGVAWANIVDGVPINADGDYTGTLFDLLGPYALLGGIVSLALFLGHGALFLTFRAAGDIAARAARAAHVVLPVAAVAGIGFLVWTIANQTDRGGVAVVSAILAGCTAVALVVATVLARSGASGRAFAATTLAITFLFSSLLADLYPNAMVSSTSPAFDLSLAEASSSEYTLTVMTVVAVVLVPIVLLYQAWTYWVFRHRIDPKAYDEGVKTPLDLMDRRRHAGEGETGGDDRQLTGTPPGG